MIHNDVILGLGRYLFKLFQHPSLAIVKAAGLIMKSIIEVCYGVPGHMISCDPVGGRAGDGSSHAGAGSG